MTQYYERVVGRDPTNVPRVFAPTIFECWGEAEAYVKRRPDTGPLDRWKFLIEHYADDVLLSREHLDDIPVY